jgi:hypothetical protein
VAIPLCGYYDRPDHTGKVWKGCRSFDDVVSALQAVERDDDPARAAADRMGVDPIYFGSDKLGREHLDRVSTTRPVAVIHMSIHLTAPIPPRCTTAEYLTTARSKAW